jgi:addiction module RelB/DinJ family antitoxin
MSSTILQHRINTDLKNKAEAILKAQGFKPSQAITIFYTEIERTCGFPFLPSKLEIPNKRLTKAIREAEKGIGLQKFTNKENFFESLKNL